MDWCRRHRFPLASSRKRRAAAPQELGVVDLAEHTRGSKVQGATQSSVATMRAVRIQTRVIDDPDAPEQRQIRAARLWDRRRGHGNAPVALACRTHLRGGRWRNRQGAWGGSGHPHEDGRSPVAQAKTRAAVPGRLTLRPRNTGGTEGMLDAGTKCLCPLHQAGQIVTYVCHYRRLWGDREQGI